MTQSHKRIFFLTKVDPKNTKKWPILRNQLLWIWDMGKLPHTWSQIPKKYTIKFLRKRRIGTSPPRVFGKLSITYENPYSKFPMPWLFERYVPLCIGANWIWRHCYWSNKTTTTLMSTLRPITWESGTTDPTFWVGSSAFVQSW